MVLLLTSVEVYIGIARYAFTQNVALLGHSGKRGQVVATAPYSLKAVVADRARGCGNSTATPPMAIVNVLDDVLQETAL